jgi:hypothetical protein
VYRYIARVSTVPHYDICCDMDACYDIRSTDLDVPIALLLITSSWLIAIPFGCSGIGRLVSCTTLRLLFCVLAKLTRANRRSPELISSLLRHRRPARHLAVLHRGRITGRYLKAMGHSLSCHADLQVVIVRRSCFDFPSCGRCVCSESFGLSSIKIRCSCQYR